TAMSRGRRKKNSTSLSGSASTSSRESRRWRYPASRSISTAGSDRDPLLGTAIRSMTGPSLQGIRGDRGRDEQERAALAAGRTSRTGAGRSQMLVHVLQAQTLRQHEDLQVVQELRDLLRRLHVALVLGGHPHLGGLLD